MTKSLPLPPRFFKCPELSPREQQYLVGKAKESANALVDATRNNEGPVRWEEAGMHRGVQIYKGEARYPESVVGEAITYGCGATTIQATLDEVADFFDLSSDDKMADFVQFNGDILDGQLLYVLEDPALLNDPKYNSRHRQGSSKMLNANQVTVKWFVLDTPSKLVKNRDFLTVECQSTFVDVSGRRGWVRSYHSIKLQCCPELQSEYGLVRGSFYHTGYVFIESERPGFLDVIFSAQVNFKGSMKMGPLYFSIQKKRLSSIADLQKMITRRRLGAQRFLGDLELVPKSERTRCNLCSAKFGIITRKARCRKCGEVVCASSCSTEWEVSISGQGVRKVRVCAKCAQNTDPSAFEDLPMSSQYSESVRSHEEDQEQPLMSVRAPGYQYAQYERSETSSGRRGPHSRGQRSVGSGSDHGSNGYRRQHSDRQRRGHYNNSYEEGYSHSGSYDNMDPEYPRTAEMPSDFTGLDSQRYDDDGDELDNYVQPSRRGDDRRYDPRYREPYESEPYGESPAYMDQRSLQRQQRALQQQNVRQQFLMQRQKQQQALLRRRQQEQRGEVEYQPRMTRQTSLGSSNFSGSDDDEDYDEPQVQLTSSLLEQHTKQMGPPGPVKRNERQAPRQEKPDRPRHRSREGSGQPPVDRRPPGHRQVSRLEQMQKEHQWELQEAAFKQQRSAKQARSPPESADMIPAFRRLSTGGSDASGARLPSFFLKDTTAGAPTGESPPSFLSVTKPGTTPGQRTVSVTDDEDGLLESGKASSTVSGLSMDFNSLLRPEDLRRTQENLSPDSSLNSMGASDQPQSSGAAAAKDRAETSKTTVVKLYQQILELTKRQHALESQPECDPKEKADVAKQLEVLYQKLNAEVEI